MERTNQLSLNYGKHAACTRLTYQINLFIEAFSHSFLYFHLFKRNAFSVNRSVPSLSLSLSIYLIFFNVKRPFQRDKQKGCLPLQESML